MLVVRKSVYKHRNTFIQIKLYWGSSPAYTGSMDVKFNVSSTVNRGLPTTEGFKVSSHAAADQRVQAGWGPRRVSARKGSGQTCSRRADDYSRNDLGAGRLLGRGHKDGVLRG